MKSSISSKGFTRDFKKAENNIATTVGKPPFIAIGRNFIRRSGGECARLARGNFKKAILLLQFPGNKNDSIYDQLAGYFTSAYPEDVFTFECDVSFTLKQNGQTHSSASVPVVILKAFF